MNPVTSVTQIIGSIASVLGLGGSMANQAMLIHRQINPPQAQVGQVNGQRPAGTKIAGVLIKPNGQRQLVCMQEKP
jgi:hypothetical protein